MNICTELIEFMYNYIMNFINKRSTDISKQISYLCESVSIIPENTKALIELESLIERIRIKENNSINNDFNEITSWLYSLINQRVRFTSEDLKGLHITSQQKTSFMDRISQEEERVKDERMKIEKQLRERREVFGNAIVVLRKEIDSLEGFGSIFLSKDANDQIDALNERLDNLSEEMEDINKNEEMLGQVQTDYPILTEAQNKLKPYEDLWRLVRDFKNKHQEWTRDTVVFKLDGEEIEKTTKLMLTTAG